ncbi:MAG: transporter associated domain-containing protein [Acidimicrobiia bacterium]
MFATFGRIPDEGDELHDSGWTFRIEEMDKRRIAKVVVRAPSGNLTPSPDGL